MTPRKVGGDLEFGDMVLATEGAPVHPRNKAVHKRLAGKGITRSRSSSFSQHRHQNTMSYGFDTTVVTRPSKPKHTVDFMMQLEFLRSSELA